MPLIIRRRPGSGKRVRPECVCAANRPPLFSALRAVSKRYRAPQSTDASRQDCRVVPSPAAHPLWTAALCAAFPGSGATPPRPPTGAALPPSSLTRRNRPRLPPTTEHRSPSPLPPPPQPARCQPLPPLLQFARRSGTSGTGGMPTLTRQPQRRVRSACAAPSAPSPSPQRVRSRTDLRSPTRGGRAVPGPDGRPARSTNLRSRGRG